MSDNSVIPGSAVEAAARMMLARQEFGGMMGGWDGLDDDERDSLLEDAKDVLEAAAPHMLAPRTYSLEDVAAEFGIDLEELRKEAD